MWSNHRTGEPLQLSGNDIGYDTNYDIDVKFQTTVELSIVFLETRYVEINN